MYIQFTKDINKIKNRIIFGLGLREIVIGTGTIGAAFGEYFLLRNIVPTDIVYYMLVPVVLLGMFFMIFKYNGMPFEKFFFYKLRRIIFTQNILHFKTERITKNEFIQKKNKK